MLLLQALPDLELADENAIGVEPQLRLHRVDGQLVVVLPRPRNGHEERRRCRTDVRIDRLVDAILIAVDVGPAARNRLQRHLVAAHRRFRLVRNELDVDDMAR